MERWLILSRYVLLLAGFLAWGGMAALSFLSQPYQSFLSILTGQTAYITWFALAYLALFLISALLIDRPFCRYFCVQGAKYGALSLARVFSIRRDADTCVHCLRCDESLPHPSEYFRQRSYSTSSMHQLPGMHKRLPGCRNSALRLGLLQTRKQRR